MNQATHLTFIGGGNLTSSLVSGLCASGYPANAISVSEPNPDKLQGFAELYGVCTYKNNIEAVVPAHIVILAVKPIKMAEVCQQLRSLIEQQQPLIISVAAGISFSQLEEWFGPNAAIVRAMPNTAAQVLDAVTGLCANKNVNPTHHTLANELFKTVGITAWFADEALLHVVTALSGSGPAYYFLFMEALTESAIALGLDPKIAEEFSVHTALGAAKLVAESKLSFAELREKVTSPQGTTARALEIMENSDMRTIIQKAVNAAYERSVEIANKEIK